VDEGLVLTHGSVEMCGKVEARSTGGDRMRKAVAMLLVVALLAGVLGFTPVRAAEGIVVQVTIGSTKATINGKEVVLDQPPIIENSLTLVPFRFIGEAIGAQIGWNPANKTVSYIYGYPPKQVSIVLTIGSKTATVNGTKTVLDVAPKILPTGRTVVPLRFVSENIGARIEWNGTARMVTVTVAATAVVFSGQIRIGMVTPLTGNVATYGQSHLKGYTMAIDEINARGGVNGKKLVLLTYDDSGVPANAATGAQKFADQKDIMLITGSCTSSSTLAMVPITAKAKIPHMVVSSSAKSLDGASFYFSRMSTQDAVVGQNMIDIMADKLKAKKIVIVYANTDSGKALLASCEAQAKVKNLEVLASISYLETDQDFSAIVTRIQSLKAEAIALCGYYTDSGLLMKQARQAGLMATGVGSTSLFSPKYIEIAGVAGEGTIVLCPFLAVSTKPIVQEFVRKYQAKYGGVTPDSYAALAYDQVYVIKAAIERAEAANNGKLTREGLAVAIRATSYGGVTGHVTFNNLGNWVRPFLTAVVKDGQWVPYE
jgi:branched-chain amino acid transport system substrate-binding protein